MSKGVIYLFAGTKHAVVAAVALQTLRDWWDGSVSMFCDETAMPFAGPIAKAATARIIPYEPVSVRRNSGYFNKTLLPSLSPYDYTVQLDLDTVVVGELGELWPEQRDEWVLTPFAGWVSDGKKVSGRIGRWEEKTPKLVADKRANPGPALNTGIMGYGPDCWVAKRVWNEVCSLNPRIFISDETAADLITGQPQWMECVRLLDDRWNWSPLYSKPNEDVRVVHCHGKKHTKSDKGLTAWWPHFFRAYRENFGGIADWWAETGDKRFKRYMNEGDVLAVIREG